MDFTPFAVLGGIALGAGFIVLLVWMDHQNKQRLRRMEQEERFRVIDAGLADEEALGRAKADAERARAAGAIGVATALGTMGAAVLLSGFLVADRRSDPWVVVAALGIVWPPAVILVGVVGLVCLRRSRRDPDPILRPSERAKGPAPINPGSTGIRESKPQ